MNGFNKINVGSSLKALGKNILYTILVSIALSYPVMFGFNNMSDALLLGEMSLIHAFWTVLSVQLLFFRPLLVSSSNMTGDIAFNGMESSK